ncbi:MAG: CYTH domain-containing protein [Verrucomicrobiota bacterium]
MPVEIERKFLVKPERLPSSGSHTTMSQGYIDSSGPVVRIRITGENDCFLTIKGPTQGMSRSEFEYPIPIDDGREILAKLCRQPLIEKTRHLIQHGSHVWEVDIFTGDNEGLIVAEVELDSEGESVELPSWVSIEVTQDPKYTNAALAQRPFSQWSAEEKSDGLTSV